MKRLVCLVLLGAVSGCATSPMVMENYVQGKIFTKCANDTFCFQSAYEVAWDSWCNAGQLRVAGTGCRYGGCDFDYPVSSRSKESILMTGADSYLVTLPAGGNIAVPQAEAREVGYE